MGAVWMRAGTAMRRGWRSLVFLTVLVGLGGGLTIAALAGARRSQQVLPTFLAAAAGPDAGVFVFDPDQEAVFGPGSDRADVLAAVSAMPGVARAARATDALVAVPDPASPSGWATLLGVTSIDAGVSDTVGAPIVLSGRLPISGSADELAINEEMAARYGLRTGSTIRLGAFSRDQFGPAGNGEPLAPDGLIAPMHVAGIVRYPADLLPVNLDRNELSADHSTVYLTPGWWAAAAPDVASYGVVVSTWVVGGDVEALRSRVGAEFGDRAFVATGSVGYEIGTGLPGVRRAIEIERFALVVFGALGAFATLLLFGQAWARRMWAESPSIPIARALGMTNAELGAAAALTVAPMAVVSGAVAALTALLLSRWFPIGVARRADLDHSMHADLLVLAVGAAVIVIVVEALAYVLGHRIVRRTASASSRRTAAGRDGGHLAERSVARLPVTVATGTRFAVDGLATARAVPAMATVFAVAAVCAATTFTGSLTRLVDEPVRYGAAWDAAVGNYADPAAALAGADWLASDPDVDAFAGLQSQDVQVDGHDVTLIITAPGEGVIAWPTSDGHAPVGADEIALGSNTMAELHKEVGDTVTVTSPELPGVARTLTIVGRAVLAPPDSEGVEPGRGALVDLAAAALLGVPDSFTFPGSYVVRFRQDVDGDAAAARLHERFFATTTYPVTPPSSVLNIERVAILPTVLAGLITVLAGAAFVHTLLAEIRHRRRELAVLETLGLAGRQISGVLAWQATVTAVIGVTIGVPLGVIAGRAAWRFVTDRLGVPWSPATSPSIVIGLCVAAVLFANVVAIGPGLRARRVRPAAALRTE